MNDKVKALYENSCYQVWSAAHSGTSNDFHEGAIYAIAAILERPDLRDSDKVMEVGGRVYKERKGK